MRKIKFRGQTIGSKHWIYGSLLVNNINPVIIEEHKHDCVTSNDIGHWMINNSAARVISQTVGQFTGLQDKNGKDIYEGDILKNERGDWGVVVSKDHCFEVTVSETQSSLYTKEYFNTSEVIGNIHENPELLNN